MREADDDARVQHPAPEPGQQPAAEGAAPAQPAEPVEPPAEKWFDESWTKVHPLSPFVRGWLTIVGIPAIIFGYNWELWADIWQAWRSGELTAGLEQNPTPYLIGAGVFMLLVVLVFGGYVLSWWFTRYQVTDEHVMVKSGIFVRQHRQARIDRVQAVDLRQPLLARITRLAELRFEVAEGDGTAATLAFLKKDQAEELRTEIMDRAAGRSSASDAETAAGHSADPYSAVDARDADATAPSGPGGSGDPAADSADRAVVAPAAAPVRPGVQDRVIAQVPVGRLIGSVLVGAGTIIFLVLLTVWGLILGGIALGVALFSENSFDEVMGGISIPVVLPLVIAAVFSYYNEFSSGFRFTATMTGAGLRLKYGLLETNTQTVPPGRVQAIQIQQPMLWRPFGWFKVVVTVAGYGLDSRSTLLPVGRREDVMTMAAEMFPDLQIPNPEEMFIEGLTGTGVQRGFTEVPARARIFDPVVRRRRGFFATPAALMIRDGRLSRRLTMVPHERIQSSSLHQGPFARMSRIATLQLHLPSGPFQARIKNQDLQAAKDLFELEAGQAAVARRMTDRNQWMLPEELREFEKMVEQVKEEHNDDARAPLS
ncbi:PH domain-containing protein [Nesterenkonia rhizosphaerae]|uniref:PH domain-containing protein n=1 Tax=Nesterenkonia rhizosphaerae TaxID=1348272 RepID=A0ABP9FQC5_9MICC